MVLNGASSAGKTTLAKALQDVFPRPFLVFGIDTVVFALPRRYLNEQWQDVFRYTYDGPRIVRIEATAYGHRLIAGLHASVAALARSGLDVIVDHVILDKVMADDLDRAFAGLDVLRVAVACPLDVLEAREQARRDRTLGQARAYHDVVFDHFVADVTVDTSKLDAGQAAAQVAAAVRS